MIAPRPLVRSAPLDESTTSRGSGADASAWAYAAISTRDSAKSRDGVYTGGMTKAPSAPLSARVIASTSRKSPSTNSTPRSAQSAALTRSRTSARTRWPGASRCRAAPPTLPVSPMTRNMLTLCLVS
ncbi:hypothetical protein tb265_41000 [Gemmatimonadetes bacterium T265]|nr:hypothetical protein tb265_41000 [Gemmatimonadetes bacterium T265]